MESAADPLSQKPRPFGSANVEGSDGIADDHPNPPEHASCVHASAHARPATRSPNVGSVRSTGIPSRLRPAANARCTLTRREVELAAFLAAASAPSQVTASTDPSNVPSAADIGTPLPASPAVGAVVRRKSSAAAMVDPP